MCLVNLDFDLLAPNITGIAFQFTIVDFKACDLFDVQIILLRPLPLPPMLIFLPLMEKEKQEENKTGWWI